jgi:hypothetical protein
MLDRKTKLRKKMCFIFQKKKTTINCFFDVDHVLIVKKIEKKVNCNLKSPLEKQLTICLFNLLKVFD